MEYKGIRNSKKGFTLIELVLVVAILAILAMIAIPTVKDMVDSAKDAAAHTNIKTIEQFFNVSKIEMDSDGQYVPIDSSNGGIMVSFSSYTDYIYPGINVDETYAALLREKVIKRVGKDTDFGYTVIYNRGSSLDPNSPGALSKTSLFIYYYPDKNDLTRYYFFQNGIVTPPTT